MAIKALLLGVSTSAFLVCAACASDPNKQANEAQNEELKSERQQLQANADARGEQRVKSAERQRENTDARATGTTPAKERTEADAKANEARDVYRAKATERLEKLDAKIGELRALVAKAGPKATTASQDGLRTIDVQHGLVTNELDQLPRVPSDEFKRAKASLDTRLDDLEGMVKKNASEVDKFKN